MIISGHYRGDTWLGISGQINLASQPLNLSGSSVRMQIRKEMDWPTFAQEWSTASGSISLVNNGISGQFLIGSGIVDVPANNYYFDVEITLPHGQVITPLRGTWDIYETVTR